MARTLCQGSRGSDVLLLQSMLNGAVPAVAKLLEDGIFGPKTAASTSQFQKHHSLKVDAIAGPVSLAVLALYHVPKNSVLLRAMTKLGWSEIAARDAEIRQDGTV